KEANFIMDEVTKNIFFNLIAILSVFLLIMLFLSCKVLSLKIKNFIKKIENSIYKRHAIVSLCIIIFICCFFCCYCFNDKKIIILNI
ncbi:MAG: hypothetical protein Q8840_02855, partial [Sweet potato little leaf phytoplasma]|nr:hypothetical protein [Sweet potato little leaf phytoplasma]